MPFKLRICSYKAEKDWWGNILENAHLEDQEGDERTIL